MDGKVFNSEGQHVADIASMKFMTYPAGSFTTSGVKRFTNQQANS